MTVEGHGSKLDSLLNCHELDGSQWGGVGGG